MGNLNKPAEVRLSPELAKEMDIEKISVDENNFRWLLNENEVATEKLSEGIRLFANGKFFIFLFFRFKKIGEDCKGKDFEYLLSRIRFIKFYKKL